MSTDRGASKPMPHLDILLHTYARSRLQQKHQSLDPRLVTDLLNSPPFKAMKDKFDADLEQMLLKYAGMAALANRKDQEVKLLVMKDLQVEQNTPTPAPTPAAAQAAPAVAPASAPLPAPPPASELPDTTFRLPNARAGDAYDQPIEAITAPDTVLYCELSSPEGLALALDQATGKLSGTPAEAGEFPLMLGYRYAGEPSGRLRKAALKLVVNANPKAMWRDLPSDSNDIYWRPDQRCDSVNGPALRMIAASKRGRSHAHVGSFRDDDYGIAAMPDAGWHIGIVADGAGSARYSRKGAAIICEEARNTLQSVLAGERSAAIDQAAQAYQLARRAQKQDPALISTLWQTLRNALYGAVGNAAYYAAKGIMDESVRHKEQQPDAAFKDYSSTALIAICKRYDFGTLCAAYWVGDGAVGIYRRQDGITLLGEVDSGEFSGQTRFLESAEVTQEALIKRTRFEIVDDMTALILMTDGVSDPKFETEARLTRPDDWHALWNELDQAVGLGDAAAGKEQKLLDWLDFWSQGNHDDRTIAIIY